MQAEAAAPRPTLRVRTTMSYKFTEALVPYFGLPLDQVPSLVGMVARAIPNGFRNIPTWTVSKRDPAEVAKRKRRR